MFLIIIFIPMKLFFFLLGSLFLTTLHAQEPHYRAFESVEDTRAFFKTSLESGSPVISGHRGGMFKNLPENSVESFEYVLANTPAIFEVDIRITKDEKVSLLHDATLERTTTGSGKITDYTLEELGSFKLKDADGYNTPFEIPTLEETIKWSKGKTIINLDVKDVPIAKKAALVKKYDAFAHVIFTVHSPEQAEALFEYDNRSMFSAFIKTAEDFAAFEASVVPWENILIAYVGPHTKKANKELYDLLHSEGVSVMVSAASSYDKLEDPGAREKAYRKIVRDGANVLETDRPLEVYEALKGM